MLLILVLWLLFLALLRWLIRHSATPLSMAELAGAFSFKVLMACLYGYLFLHYYRGDDTWLLHNNSLKEYQLLRAHPGEFFWEYTPVTAWRNGQGHWWSAFQFYLVDLEYFLTAKTLGLFNLISGGNYYANAVFFSFLTFWGHYWLFQLLTRLFPQRRTLLLLLVFFFPPALFWLSGMRADGLLFTFLSLLLLHTYYWLQHRKKWSWLYALMGLAGVLILRNALLLLLVPTLAAWFITVRSKAAPWRVFALVYGICLLLFFGSTYLSPPFNLPAVVVERQQAFLVLQGNTRFRLDPLSPDLPGFVQVLPQAWANAFVRPWPWEAKGLLQVMATLETVLFWALLLLALSRPDKDRPPLHQHPLVWVLLCFSLTLYFFIGYTIPFPGAIVRYKIIPELFLLTLFVVRLRPLRLSGNRAGRL